MVVFDLQRVRLLCPLAYSFFVHSDCGKTRAVIELLSQHWGFYFNVSSDDRGSNDMITLHSTIEKHLHKARSSFIVDRRDNNRLCKKADPLAFPFSPPDRQILFERSWQQ